MLGANLRNLLRSQIQSALKRQDALAGNAIVDCKRNPFEELGWHNWVQCINSQYILAVISVTSGKSSPRYETIFFRLIGYPLSPFANIDSI
jgi:hypothetical protein